MEPGGTPTSLAEVPSPTSATNAKPSPRTSYLPIAGCTPSGGVQLTVIVPATEFVSSPFASTAVTGGGGLPACPDDERSSETERLQAASTAQQSKGPARTAIPRAQASHAFVSAPEAA